ncbi:hypothetical protein C2845_PM11G05230 [Panicum miliaceum]|uniref:Uncharacterized protein n=1 Tax=Panicum miliaceum TaxID=4540 RepID=A0A3L6RWG1_PANMI|nr:hypothetical protein C2845_PM11G05230 [Panicum miliaceum]
MEVVEGMMEQMKLSAAERKGIKVEAGGAVRAWESKPQAIGKVFAEKLRALLPDLGKAVDDAREDVEGQAQEEDGADVSGSEGKKKEAVGNSTVHPMPMDVVPAGAGAKEGDGDELSKEKSGRGGKYKRLARQRTAQKEAMKTVQFERKRHAEEADVEMVDGKKQKPPATLSTLYAEMEKYARSKADHKRKVELRKVMRQTESTQQGWNNQSYQNPRHQAPQLVLPVKARQEDEPQNPEPFMTPPQNNQSQTFEQPSHSGGWNNRRGRG